MSTSNELFSEKAATGIEGLDDILSGGLSRSHLFLLEGEPGTGKTTVALHFLQAGAKNGEKSLYITLSETERELRQGAKSHGWDLDDNIHIFELTPPESLLNAEHQQSLLYSSDLELGEATRQIFEVVERVNAYQLATIAAVLPFASLSDVLGHRLVFLGGLLVFIVASLFCGLAWSLPTLTAARGGGPGPAEFAADEP